jgi:hypothetical protein
VCLCVYVCVCVCVNEFLRIYLRWTKTYVECIFIPKTYIPHRYLCIDILSGMSQGCLVCVCVCVNEFLRRFDILCVMDENLHGMYLHTKNLCTSYVSVTPHMVTNSFQERGLPIWEFLC